MKSQSYYRLDGDCDIRETERPLVVNCAGLYLSEEAFMTDNSSGRQDIYLMYLAQGTLPVQAAGKEYALSPGSMFFFPPERPFRYGRQAGDTLCYYWAHFTGGGAEQMLEGYGLDLGVVYQPGSREEVAEDFRMLFRCFYSKGPLSDAEAAGTLAALLARLARRVAQRNQEGPGPWRIRKSLDYIYRNYAQPIRLKELADMEHLSPSRYSAVFRACMCVSPQEFLIGLRIQNAADLMRRTDLSVSQVAQAVGYGDPLYFSGLFRRRMGLPPSRYRERFSSQ